MKIEHALKAVYTYFLPEVRSLAAEVSLLIAPEMLMTQSDPGRLDEALRQLGIAIDIPRTKRGYVDLDRLHEPILERVAHCYDSTAEGVAHFGWRYPTFGSSEGIFHILAEERARGTESITVLRGEYEGIEAQASNLGMSVKTIDLNSQRLDLLPPGLWYLSNPSARNGNSLPPETIRSILGQGNRVIIDLAYVGATQSLKLDLTHPGIAYVVCSLSKPFGLFRQRIGYTFSRRELPSLYSNCWFKDIGRHILGIAVLEKFGLTHPWLKYQGRQREIIQSLATTSGIPFEPSEVFLIATLHSERAAHLNAEQRLLLSHYRRGEHYRLCLTPFFEDLERRPVAPLDNRNNSVTLPFSCAAPA